MQNKLAFFCILFAVASIVFSVLAFYAESPLIVFLSYFLFLSIAGGCLFVNGNDVFSPLTWFSITYMGYVVGGVYYSFGELNYGKFLVLTGTPFEVVPGYLVVSLVWAILCYFMFCFGYGFFSSKASFLPRAKSGDLSLLPGFSLVSRFVIPVLLLLGFLYWVYVAYQAAGGILGIIVKFQAFRHLIADTNISTLPYHFYYAGILLWLLVLVKDGRTIGLVFIMLSFLGMVINLTQGRIMLSITFILAQVFFVGLAKGDRTNSLKVFFYIGLLGAGAIAIYFLRILSNYYFIGSDAAVISGDTSFYKSFLDKIVGSGNVADLQQLVIIFRTWSWDAPLMGVTYFDWIRNSVGAFFGMSPSSIGLTIKEVYFSSASGAPTPGAIGEAYVNFSVLGPFFMMFVGAVFSIVYQLVKQRGSYVLLMVYSVFLARFILLYPKVDSTMMLNFLWGVVPFLLTVICISLFVWAGQKSVDSNSISPMVRDDR